MMEDDIPSATLFSYFLKRNGFDGVVLFQDEKTCLASMKLEPKVLITDYQLKTMNGISLVQKARKLYPGFYSILISGMHYREIFTDNSKEPCIDKFIMKGLDSLQEVYNTLNSLSQEKYIEHYY